MYRLIMFINSVCIFTDIFTCFSSLYLNFLHIKHSFLNDFQLMIFQIANAWLSPPDALLVVIGVNKQNQHVLCIFHRYIRASVLLGYHVCCAWLTYSIVALVIVFMQLKTRFANMKEGAKIVSSRAFCSLSFHISDRNLSGKNLICK